MNERLTDEQVAEALAAAPWYAEHPDVMAATLPANGHGLALSNIAQAFLQVSADLSDEKAARRKSEFAWTSMVDEAEAALSALQEKARAVLAARSCCDPACCKASSEHTKALEALAEELR